MAHVSDILNDFYEAYQAVKPLPDPQFLVVHPDDFLAVKENLESKGMAGAVKPGTNMWDFRLVSGTLSSGVLIKVAVSEDAPKGKVLQMPMLK